MSDEELDFLGYEYGKAHFRRTTPPHTNLYLSKENLEGRLNWLEVNGLQRDKTEQALNNWPKE